jgi:hypothetical protein
MLKREKRVEFYLYYGFLVGILGWFTVITSLANLLVLTGLCNYWLFHLLTHLLFFV